MTKQFTHAGVSRRTTGEMKMRFATDAMRVKVITKGGDRDIDIVELKHPMNKEDAIAFLMSIDFANGNAEVQAVLEAEVEKRTEKAPKVAKVVKAKTVNAIVKGASKEQKPNKEAKKPKKAAAPKKAVTTDPAVTGATFAQAEALVGEALL